MAAQTIKIEGLKELDIALRELPKATSRNVLKRALTKAAKPIETAAQAKVPVLTGALKQSIKIGPKSKLDPKVRSTHIQKSPVEVFVGAGALPHAHLIELGAAGRAAHPFLRPAFDENKQGALESIKRDIAEEIEKARARLARKAERLAAKIKAGK